LTIFRLHEPQNISCGVVFNSPHSGSLYPPAFLARARLSLKQLRQSEDFCVQELFSGVVDEGMPLLEALFPRAMVDANREPYELDPQMFTDPLPAFAVTRSPRILSGLGTVPKVVTGGKLIYEGKLAVEEALFSIEQYYKPYHRQLKALLHHTRHMFGEALLIDCHSMPSAASPHSGYDFILGDRFGMSAGADILRLIEEVLVYKGYRVGRNCPYAGGFITEHYGEPRAGIHALQIEVNRRLYMCEERLELKPFFTHLQQDMTDLSGELRDYYMTARSMAAE
jgi:N-formylglutamate amidohydrolase